MSNLALLRSLNIDLSSVPYEVDRLSGLETLSEEERWALCVISNIPTLSESQMVLLNELTGISVEILEGLKLGIVLPDTDIRALLASIGRLFTANLGHKAYKLMGGIKDTLKDVFAPNKQVSVGQVPIEIYDCLGLDKAVLQNMVSAELEVYPEKIIDQLKQLKPSQVQKVTSSVYGMTNVEAHLRGSLLSVIGGIPVPIPPVQPPGGGGGCLTDGYDTLVRESNIDPDCLMLLQTHSPLYQIIEGGNWANLYLPPIDCNVGVIQKEWSFWYGAICDQCHEWVGYDDVSYTYYSVADVAVGRDGCLYAGVISTSWGQYAYPEQSWGEMWIPEGWLVKVNRDGDLVWQKRIESHYYYGASYLSTSTVGTVLALENGDIAVSYMGGTNRAFSGTAPSGIDDGDYVGGYFYRPSYAIFDSDGNVKHREKFRSEAGYWGNKPPIYQVSGFGSTNGLPRPTLGAWDTLDGGGFATFSTLNNYGYTLWGMRLNDSLNHYSTTSKRVYLGTNIAYNPNGMYIGGSGGKMLDCVYRDGIGLMVWVSGDGPRKVQILRFANDLDIVWMKNFQRWPSDQPDVPHWFPIWAFIDEHNNTVICGHYVYVPGVGNYTAGVMKVSPTGTVLWEKYFPQNTSGPPWALTSIKHGCAVPNSTDYVFVGAFHRPVSEGGAKRVVFRTDTNGNVLWARSLKQAVSWPGNVSDMMKVAADENVIYVVYHENRESAPNDKQLRVDRVTPDGTVIGDCADLINLYPCIDVPVGQKVPVVTDTYPEAVVPRTHNRTGDPVFEPEPSGYPPDLLVDTDGLKELICEATSIIGYAYAFLYCAPESQRHTELTLSTSWAPWRRGGLTSIGGGEHITTGGSDFLLPGIGSTLQGGFVLRTKANGDVRWYKQMDSMGTYSASGSGTYGVHPWGALAATNRAHITSGGNIVLAAIVGNKHPDEQHPDWGGWTQCDRLSVSVLSSDGTELLGAKYAVATWDMTYPWHAVATHRRTNPSTGKMKDASNNGMVRPIITDNNGTGYWLVGVVSHEWSSYCPIAMNLTYGLTPSHVRTADAVHLGGGQAWIHDAKSDAYVKKAIFVYNDGLRDFFIIDYNPDNTIVHVTTWWWNQNALGIPWNWSMWYPTGSKILSDGGILVWGWWRYAQYVAPNWHNRNMSCLTRFDRHNNLLWYRLYDGVLDTVSSECIGADETNDGTGDLVAVIKTGGQLKLGRFTEQGMPLWAVRVKTELGLPFSTYYTLYMETCAKAGSIVLSNWGTWYEKSCRAMDVSGVSNTISITSPNTQPLGWSDGVPLQYYNHSGGYPDITGLVSGHTYYVLNCNLNHFQLSETYDPLVPIDIEMPGGPPTAGGHRFNITNVCEWDIQQWRFFPDGEDAGDCSFFEPSTVDVRTFPDWPVLVREVDNNITLPWDWGVYNLPTSEGQMRLAHDAVAYKYNYSSMNYTDMVHGVAQWCRVGRECTYECQCELTDMELNDWIFGKGWFCSGDCESGAMWAQHGFCGEWDGVDCLDVDQIGYTEPLEIEVPSLVAGDLYKLVFEYDGEAWSGGDCTATLTPFLGGTPGETIGFTCTPTPRTTATMYFFAGDANTRLQFFPSEDYLGHIYSVKLYYAPNAFVDYDLQKEDRGHVLICKKIGGDSPAVAVRIHLPKAEELGNGYYFFVRTHSLKAQVYPYEDEPPETRKDTVVPLAGTADPGDMFELPEDSSMLIVNGDEDDNHFWYVVLLDTGVTATTSDAEKPYWSALLSPVKNLTLTMDKFTTRFLIGNDTGSSMLFKFTDTVNNTGTGAMLRVETSTDSELNPLRVEARGYPALFLTKESKVGIGKDSPSGFVNVRSLLDQPEVVVQANTLQTQRVQEWKDGDGTTVLALTAEGALEPSAIFSPFTPDANNVRLYVKSEGTSPNKEITLVAKTEDGVETVISSIKV